MLGHAEKPPQLDQVKSMLRNLGAAPLSSDSGRTDLSMGSDQSQAKEKFLSVEADQKFLLVFLTISEALSKLAEDSLKRTFLNFQLTYTEVFSNKNGQSVFKLPAYFTLFSILQHLQKVLPHYSSAFLTHDPVEQIVMPAGTESDSVKSAHHRLIDPQENDSSTEQTRTIIREKLRLYYLCQSLQLLIRISSIMKNYDFETLLADLENPQQFKNVEGGNGLTIKNIILRGQILDSQERDDLVELLFQIVNFSDFIAIIKQAYQGIDLEKKENDKIALPQAEIDMMFRNIARIYEEFEVNYLTREKKK